MGDIPPFASMMQMLAGFQLSQALYVAAELDVARLVLEKVTGYRDAFGRPGAVVGEQPEVIGSTRI